MRKEKTNLRPLFGEPATYRIILSGVMSGTLRDRIGGLRIEQDDERATVLVGELMDQAELNGILNTIYQLHLPILEVRFMPLEQTPRPASES